MTTPAGVLKTISRVGVQVTFTRVVEGPTFDPALGSVTTTTTTVEHVPAILMNYTGNNFAPGTVVEVGDKKLLVPAAGLSYTPAPGDRVAVKDVSYVVVSVDSTDPLGDDLFYEVQVRR